MADRWMPRRPPEAGVPWLPLSPLETRDQQELKIISIPLPIDDLPPPGSFLRRLHPTELGIGTHHLPIGQVGGPKVGASEVQARGNTPWQPSESNDQDEGGDYTNHGVARRSGSDQFLSGYNRRDKKREVGEGLPCVPPHWDPGTWFAKNERTCWSWSWNWNRNIVTPTSRGEVPPTSKP
ncbi:uncharacterized protein KD926_007851 [Aspergillus affinis]|uniref:uncharacterized protein n=1 Tax=Aspergillus affinis TaxID=1070780 RepID=UPI0022FEE6B0|nr:uncharacterized protein KD926_007851 [Aspergillus affinis]KAI9040635.1 hypothetical protein KD926_007851 [Aspergillus affinis]